LSRIPGILDCFGRSTILPRETREHRAHFAETSSRGSQRHSWKSAAMLSSPRSITSSPPLFAENIFSIPSKLIPSPFSLSTAVSNSRPAPTPHQVPHYYVQRLGSAVSHPNTNEFAAFAQDTIRVNEHLGLTAGVRYDLQTFATKYLKSNPLWPDSGKVSLDLNNFAPRAGIS